VNLVNYSHYELVFHYEDVLPRNWLLTLLMWYKTVKVQQCYMY